MLGCYYSSPLIRWGNSICFAFPESSNTVLRISQLWMTKRERLLNPWLCHSLPVLIGLLRLSSNVTKYYFGNNVAFCQSVANKSVTKTQFLFNIPSVKYGTGVKKAGLELVCKHCAKQSLGAIIFSGEDI